tara:strand:- start:3830 stop:4765 length:936 start_codon:yes stop_codon:yes gene_type:complete
MEPGNYSIDGSSSKLRYYYENVGSVSFTYSINTEQNADRLYFKTETNVNSNATGSFITASTNFGDGDGYVSGNVTGAFTYYLTPSFIDEGWFEFEYDKDTVYSVLGEYVRLTNFSIMPVETDSIKVYFYDIETNTRSVTSNFDPITKSVDIVVSNPSNTDVTGYVSTNNPIAAIWCKLRIPGDSSYDAAGGDPYGDGLPIGVGLNDSSGAYYVRTLDSLGELLPGIQSRLPSAGNPTVSAVTTQAYFLIDEECLRSKSDVYLRIFLGTGIDGSYGLGNGVPIGISIDIDQDNTATDDDSTNELTFDLWGLN